VIGTTLGKTGTWLLDTMFILFWCDCVLAVAFSCGIFLVMWSTQTFTIEAMTPVWIFPAYPLLIIGPHAAVLSAHLENIRALYVIVGGWIFQGIGFLVSLMVYASFIYRLMTQKLPRDQLRPGMFISVGPSGFTIAGVVNMGQVLPHVVPDNFMDNGYLAGQIGKISSIWIGLWLWGLAFWFFIVSVGAHWSCVRDRKMTFAMTWYSFIFPNTGEFMGAFRGKARADADVSRSIDDSHLRDWESA
jgi:tellurite resistance protein TehA-like permease